MNLKPCVKPLLYVKVVLSIIVLILVVIDFTIYAHHPDTWVDKAIEIYLTIMWGISVDLTRLHQ